MKKQLSEAQVEKLIIKEITRKDKDTLTFEEMVNGFKRKLAKFDPVKNSFEIETYFGHNIGKTTITENLIKAGKIKKDWIKPYKTKTGKTRNGLKGLYVFLHKDIPFYVGISKNVIARLEQHLKGKNHNTSTLAFNMTKLRKKIKGEEHTGTRDKLDYDEVLPAKEFLKRQKLAIINFDNDDELYIFEVYTALKLKTFLNNFGTH
jgi:predicted GIY-YIG superfamily endonuclease